MIKIGPESERSILIGEMVEVSKKVMAKCPAEHAIVDVPIKGNKTWTKIHRIKIIFDFDTWTVL